MKKLHHFLSVVWGHEKGQFMYRPVGFYFVVPVSKRPFSKDRFHDSPNEQRGG